MNRKIEIAKKKRQQKDLEKKLVDKQIESQQGLIKAIDGLYELLNGQEQYDFDKLSKQLSEIDKRLDLTPYFSSLEKSLSTKTRSVKLTNPFLKTKITGFSELLRAVKSLNDKIKESKEADDYKASDVSYESGQNYFGFISQTGRWYIMRQSGSNGGIFRYSSGDKDYLANWTRRASLTYKLYNQVKI